MKLIVGVVALVVGMVTSATAEQRSRFDLKCHGSGTTDENNNPHHFERTIHVDLVTGNYCNDACQSVGKIKSADPLKIVLEDEAGSLLRQNRVIVDRRTGKLNVAELNVHDGHWTVADATCSPAPFTPFPATKF